MRMMLCGAGRLKRCFSLTLKGMEVHSTTEQETQLAQLATKAGTDAEQLVKDTILRLIEDETPSGVRPRNCRPGTSEP